MKFLILYFYSFIICKIGNIPSHMLHAFQLTAKEHFYMIKIWGLNIEKLSKEQTLKQISYLIGILRTLGKQRASTKDNSTKKKKKK
jgi:galactose-1-phosphate uridylyltransferase